MGDHLQKLFSKENLARFERVAPLHDDATIKREVVNEATRRQKKKELVEREKKFTPEELEHQQVEALKQKKKEEKKAKRKIKPKKSESEAATETDKAKVKVKGKDSDDGDSDSEDDKNDDNLMGDGDDKARSADAARTLFVGNVPIHHTTKSLTKLFCKFGDIESIRIRSIPVAGLAVDDAGNQTLVRKVTAFKKDYGQQKASFNAYIVFKDASSLEKALVMNNAVLEGGEKGAKNRHIRVDYMQATPFDPKCTVFVGALPHYCDEEDLREHFAKKLPNKQKDIANIRVIRDQETMIGKGIGYVQFVDSTCVMKAISLHQQPYKKRWKLRITTCGKRTKRLQKNNSVGTVVNSRSADLSDTKSNGKGGGDKGSRGRVPNSKDGKASRDGSEGRDGVVASRKRKSMNGSSTSKDSKDSNDGDKKKKPRWRDLTEDQIEARKQASVAARSAAVKRIEKARSKMGTKNTRMKVLKEKGQVKAQKGRKGKRLGGAVKKAMKAQKGT